MFTEEKSFLHFILTQKKDIILYKRFFNSEYSNFILHESFIS